MKNLARHLLGVFILAGIFAACSSTEPYIEQAQVNIYTQNFDSAYAILDRQIEATPSNGVPYYYKAMAQSEEAKTIEAPSDRMPLYQNFRENAVTARQLFTEMEEKPAEAGQVNDLILSTWGREHNSGLEYVTDDSLKATVEQPLERAIDHLENAVVINPDSALSFEVLGQVQLMANNYEAAAEPLARALEIKDPAEAQDYNRLASVYATNQDYEASLNLLNEGLEIYPDSVFLNQQLADVYMQSGDRASSIAVLEELLERDPDNAQYHLALGTQILQATTELSDQVAADYDKIYELRDERRNASASEKEEINTQIAALEEEITALNEEFVELSADAETELLAVLELQPENIAALNAIGIIYQNKAVMLFDKRNYTEDLEESQEYDTQAKEQLREAMGYFEKVIEQDSENTNAWRSLAQIYTTLGMNDKAEEAMEKAGM